LEFSSQGGEVFKPSGRDGLGMGIMGLENTNHPPFPSQSKSFYYPEQTKKIEQLTLDFNRVLSSHIYLIALEISKRNFSAEENLLSLASRACSEVTL